MFRILGEGQLSLTKFLFAIDADLPIHDFRQVLPYVLERADFSTDLFIFDHLSMDSLDYAGREINKGSKGVLFGLGPKKRDLPERLTADLPSELVRGSEAYCPGCLVVEVAGYAQKPELGSLISALPGVQGWPLVIMVDDLRKALSSQAAFLWNTFTRFEPAGDIHMGSVSTSGTRVVYAGPMVIDARMKPWYPKELFCDERTSKLVASRWGEYFSSGEVLMGESDRGHL
jgi:3-polyprenyl-4-hydroxybenzoate decarboxylase